VKNMRTWCAWFQVAVLATVAASGCVENDDKKGAAPAPAAQPATPVVPPEPKRAAMPVDPAIAYTITNAAATKCLQFAGGSKEDVAAAEVAPCNGSKAQQFNLQTVPGGYYAVINANSGKCLDVSAFAMEDGALVQQYACNGGANHNWILAEGNAGAVRLIARHSGKALTIQDAGGPTATGKVTQLTAGNAVTQALRIRGPNAVAEAEGAGGHKGKDAKDTKDGTAGTSGHKGKKSAAATTPPTKKP